MTTETNHAEANGTGHAKTIEALYEMACWELSPGEIPMPGGFSRNRLTEQTATILDEIGWDAVKGTPETLQEAITDYANGMPLSVLVRSGWYVPGTPEQQPEEFEILLSTGGPACRIIGELDGGSVAWQSGCRPVMQHQDWFKPWTEISYDIDTNALLWFCEQFYYGE